MERVVKCHQRAIYYLFVLPINLNNSFGCNVSIARALDHIDCPPWVHQPNSMEFRTELRHLASRVVCTCESVVMIGQGNAAP